MSSSSFALKSTNIVFEDKTEPVEAIILVENQKISDIVFPKEADSATLANLYKNWDVIDYGDLVVFSGLIDSNVHLHADFDSEWENITYCTETAASGGVTMIVDNPSMCKAFSSGEVYIKNLKERIDTIQSNSKLDFGVFGVLDPQTQSYTAEMSEAGALGFKCYLLSTSDSSVGHFQPEVLPVLLDQLQKKHEDPLLIVHSEIATDRELYLTSPCRTVAVENRLNLNYDLKSIELGGAANKGSYFEDFAKEAASSMENDDDHLETSVSDLRSPTQLRRKVQKIKESMEINDIVNFELQSYGFDRTNDDLNLSHDKDSLDNVMQKFGSEELLMDMTDIKLWDVSPESSPRKTVSSNEPARIPLFKDAKSGERPRISSQVRSFDLVNNKSPYKKSRFASISLDEQKQNSFNHSNGEVKKDFSQLVFKMDKTQQKAIITEEQNEENTLGENHKRLMYQTSIELTHPENVQDAPSSPDDINESTLESQHNFKTDFFKIHAIEEKLDQSVDLTSRTICEDVNLDISRDLKNESLSPYKEESTTSKSDFIKLSNQINILGSNDDMRTSTNTLLLSSVFNNDREDEIRVVSDSPDNRSTDTIPPLSRGFRRLTASLEQIQVPFFNLEKVSETAETQSLVASPVSRSKSKTAGSSLLNRRLTRQDSSDSINSANSSMCSATRNYSWVNALDISKNSENVMKKEAKMNQSYQIFSANRPQSWEENAVSITLEAIKEETKVRVILQNLSLASSFLKIREKKKSNEVFSQKIIGDTSPAYLSLSSNMIKDGETQYKVSPPIRSKENREILVEKMRLGGIDMLSSYNFFVPARYKLRRQGNFRMASGGLESIGCSLQAVWTSMYCYQHTNNPKFKEDKEYRKQTINQFLMKMSTTLCSNPAKVLKVSHCKGSIKKGMDADFVVWDPFKVKHYDSLSGNHVFAGKQLLGVVQKTYLRGKLIYSQEYDERVYQDYQPKFVKPQTIVN